MKGKNRKGLKSQRGFTLVEIMVAMILMVMGIFAVITMQTVGLQSNSIANQLTVATGLASQAIEEISSAKWSDNGDALTNGTNTLTYGVDNQVYDTYSYNSTYSHLSPGSYTIYCSPALNTPIPGIVRLDVTATYSYKGNTKSVMLTGYKRII